MRLMISMPMLAATLLMGSAALADGTNAPPPAAPIFYCPTPPVAATAPAANPTTHSWRGACPTGHRRVFKARHIHRAAHRSMVVRVAGTEHRYNPEDYGTSASQAWVYRYELSRGGLDPWEVNGRRHDIGGRWRHEEQDADAGHYSYGQADGDEDQGGDQYAGRGQYGQGQYGQGQYAGDDAQGGETFRDYVARRFDHRQQPADQGYASHGYSSQSSSGEAYAGQGAWNDDQGYAQGDQGYEAHGDQGYSSHGVNAVATGEGQRGWSEDQGYASDQGYAARDDGTAHGDRGYVVHHDRADHGDQGYDTVRHGQVADADRDDHHHSHHERHEHHAEQAHHGHGDMDDTQRWDKGDRYSSGGSSSSSHYSYEQRQADLNGGSVRGETDGHPYGWAWGDDAHGQHAGGRHGGGEAHAMADADDDSAHYGYSRSERHVMSGEDAGGYAHRSGGGYSVSVEGGDTGWHYRDLDGGDQDWDRSHDGDQGGDRQGDDRYGPPSGGEQHWRANQGGGYEVYRAAGRDSNGYLTWAGKPRDPNQ